MKRIALYSVVTGGLFYVISLAVLAGGAAAHDLDGAGLPVCLEGNFMVADATGPGRVYEMNTMTGDIGIIVNRPFNGTTPDLPTGVVSPGPWKPTGVLSGGVNGHAFINGAAQHTVSEFHRDGTHIRTVRPITAPDPGAGFGAMPRLLGSQFMPNGNIILAVCDANFGDTSVFPPVSSSPERAANSRLLVLDPDTLEAVDEYSMPDDDRWTCMAGIIFSEEGMYVSMFHGAAVFVIDWKAGLNRNQSTGIGSNDANGFELGKPKNVAEVIRVIDMYPGADDDDPRRRDSLRAITFDADGNLYATNRARATEINPGPADMRQHVAVVPWGEDSPTGTLAMDHGVQIIAGIRTNRISGPGCDSVWATTGPGDPLRDCDYETLYVASTGTKTVLEYLIRSDKLDGPDCRDLNIGCAQPIATFFGGANGQVDIDPRMLMTIHEAFVQ